MTFGPRMRQRRLQIGLSQGELSRRTGIHTTRLSEFENGVRTDMTLSTALKLARALGMSLDALAGTWEEEATPTPAADRKSTRLNSSHSRASRMPSSA